MAQEIWRVERHPTGTFIASDESPLIATVHDQWQADLIASAPMLRDERDTFYKAILAFVNGRGQVIFDEKSEKEYGDLVTALLQSRAYAEDCQRLAKQKRQINERL